MAETEPHLRPGEGRVANGDGLHVLLVPSLPVFLPWLAAMEGAKLVQLLFHYVTFVDYLFLLGCLLAMRKHDSTKVQ